MGGGGLRAGNRVNIANDVNTIVGREAVRCYSCTEMSAERLQRLSPQWHHYKAAGYGSSR
jgi:hypothetical protein